VPEWLNQWLFKPWPGHWLERDQFEDILYGTGVGIALITAGLLIVEQFVRRAGVKINAGTVKWLCIGLTVVGFLNYFGYFNPNTRYVNYYHRHEFFHYYLGAKYSSQLGYTRLYECAAIAEAELGHRNEIAKQEIRDLREANLIKPIRETYVLSDPKQCTSHFSDQEWADFKQDVKWFRGSASGNYWLNMKKDHGYNPPPVWTMTGKLFSMLGPASDGMFKLLATLDILLHIGTLAMLRWAFGWRIAMLASVFWGCNTAANFYWTGGAFLRQDWAFLFISSMCLAKKQRFGLAGAAFVWCGLLRIFPFAAGFGWGALIVMHWLKHRRLHPSHRRFIAGCALALGLLVPASIAATGVDAYTEFARHISLHKNTPLTNHMGLPVILSHNWEGRMRFTRDDSYNDSFELWKQGRLDRTAARQPILYAVWLFLMAWIVWALHRTRQFWLGLPLSVPLVMSMTNLTCYYFVLFLVFAALARLRPPIGLALVTTAACSQILLAHFYWIDDRYTALSYLYLAMGLCVLYAMSRKPTSRALTEWFASLKFNKPESAKT
jgi:hypothetical protein